MKQDNASEPTLGSVMPCASLSALKSKQRNENRDGARGAPGKLMNPVLRQWKNSDLESFAQMNADAEVMRYFLAPLTRGESQATITLLSGESDRHRTAQAGDQRDARLYRFTT